MVSNIKRVAIALHSGAKGNREAMMGNKVYKFTEEILDANMRDLSPEELRLVEGIWELFEKDIWPLLAEAHVRMTGFEPEFVDKYFPLNFDPKLAVRAGHMLEVNTQRESLFYNRKVNDRMVQKRQRGMLPPDLSMAAMHRSITDSIHYITHSSVIRDLNKVVMHEGYADMFPRATSKHHFREVKNWVKEMAAPHQTENRGGAYDDFFGKVRRNYTMYALGLNLAVSAKQALSLLNVVASREVGAKHTGLGLARYLKNPLEAHRYVRSMSPEMATRSKGHGYERDVMTKFHNELNPLRSRYGSAVDHFKDFTMSFIRLVDMMTTTVSWLAGESAGLQRSGGNRIAGVVEGNRIVRRTQPSGKARDLPPITRNKGELGKMVSMFYSFLSVVYNMNSEAVHGLIKDGRIGHFMAALVFVNVIPGIAATQIDVGVRERRLLTAGEAAVGAVSLPLAGLPLVRDIGKFMIDEAQDKYHKFQVSPVEGALHKGAALPGKIRKDLEDGEYMEMALELTDFLMMATGLPGMQAKRTVKGATQLAEGDTDDWTRLAFPQ
jgi:hypothetical protein